jgi:hypothetical protein
MKDDQRWSVMPASILDKHLKDMDASALKVYMYLSRWSNGDGEVWHSQATIAERCGISTRSVVRAIAYLREIGALQIPRKGRAGVGTNKYDLGTIGRRRGGKAAQGDTHVTLEPSQSDTHVTHKVTPVSPSKVTPVSPEVTTREVTTNEVTPLTPQPLSPRDMVEFEKFWEAYPYSTNKSGSMRAYATALTKASHRDILEGAKGYARQCKDKETTPRFVMATTNWLSREQWAEDYPKPKRRERGWAEVAE